MFKKDDLVNRVKQLRQEVENSANNHNRLVGRLAEAMYMLKVAEKIEKKEQQEQQEQQEATDVA